MANYKTNLTVMYSDVTRFVESLDVAGIEISASSTTLHSRLIKCRYLNNSDGTIRWIWPAASRHADFLRFYHTSDRLSHLFYFLAALLAPFGLLKLLSAGFFNVYVSEASGAGMAQGWSGRWAWFSGTLGPHRKIVFWHRENGKDADVFIKIPMTEGVVLNLVKEYGQLRSLRALELRSIVAPQTSLDTAGCLFLSDIGNATRRTNSVAQLPVDALQEWLEAGKMTVSYKETFFAREIDRMINSLTAITDKRISAQMKEGLEALYKGTNKDGVFVSTFSHGDFTPWNVMIHKHMLHVVDWEMANQDMPVLYDLFHFVYQSNILVGGGSYEQIHCELDALFAKAEWKKWLEEHHIDLLQAEKWYLLYTVSYYLDIYVRQPQWHMQVQCLVNVWSEAVAWHLVTSGHSSVRKGLLRIPTTPATLPQTASPDLTQRTAGY